MKSRTQTVRTRQLNEPEWFLATAQKPVCARPVPPGHALVWRAPDGTLTYFYDTGDVERIEPTGYTTIWMERPTPTYVINLPPHSGMYVEFLTNGGVETRWNGERVFWGPEEPATDIAPLDEVRLIKWPPNDAEWMETLVDLLERGWEETPLNSIEAN